MIGVSTTIAAQPQPSESIRPFRIRIPDAAVTDLKARLAAARLPEPLQGDGWTHGTDIGYLRQLVAYWRNGFDWRAQERRLNQLEQFTTTIDGLTVHFVHRRSKNANALPLLMTHGWPGSFVEFTKIIGPLTDPEAHGGSAADAFHVVMPSIPGFAFSQAPREPGYDPARIAALEAKLMARLGYSRYGVQGGDWGSIISTQVALADAPHVAGLHLNMCFGAAPAGTDPNAGLTDRERERVRIRQAFQNEETGYQQIQGTKPQTLGVALNDSPVGLASWIVEKFRTWCDCNGDPETVFTKDELLTNISLYWFTQTAASSARIYYESRHAAAVGNGRPPHRGADRVRGFPEGGHLVAAALAGRPLQHHAVDRDAQGRAFCRFRAAAVAGRGPARVLSRPARGAPIAVLHKSVGGTIR